ncbi:MAG: RNA ligase [Halobacteria archaeon]
MEVHEPLGLTEEEFESLLEKFDSKTWNSREYLHLPDYRKNIERGTVLFDDEVVRGFPKIPRTLNLENGIPRYFGEDKEIAVEEKYNGYNTRIAQVDGEYLAFTRGGIICPFTTAKARDLLDLDGFFSDNPEMMLCCEMAGIENPYTATDYPEIDGLGARVFDVRDRVSGDSLTVQERRELTESYGMENVSLFGVFDVDDAPDEVARIIEELDSEGREGVVMKTLDIRKQLKYTTSSAANDALEYAFRLLFDYGKDFMFRRLMTEIFQAHELNDEEERKEQAHRIGESILLPAAETVDTVKEGGEVGENHVIEGDPEVITETLEHLEGLGLKIVIKKDETVDGERRVRFMKRMQSTNDKTESFLDGTPLRS